MASKNEGFQAVRTMPRRELGWQVQANERLERFTRFAAELLEPFPDHTYERRQVIASLARYVLALGLDGAYDGHTFEDFGEIVEDARERGLISSDTYDAICRWLAEVV
ncbi:MAG: hypothetical protein OEW52_00245 [Thermoleophilia bacterium]|nr:hypothetical protein [Thermoleophilia bacterium]